MVAQAASQQGCSVMARGGAGCVHKLSSHAEHQIVSPECGEI